MVNSRSRGDHLKRKSKTKTSRVHSFHQVYKRLFLLESVSSIILSFHLLIQHYQLNQQTFLKMQSSLQVKLSVLIVQTFFIFSFTFRPPSSCSPAPFQPFFAVALAAHTAHPLATRVTTKRTKSVRSSKEAYCQVELSRQLCVQSTPFVLSM